MQGSSPLKITFCQNGNKNKYELMRRVQEYVTVHIIHIIAVPMLRRLAMILPPIPQRIVKFYRFIISRLSKLFTVGEPGRMVPSHSDLLSGHLLALL